MVPGRSGYDAQPRHPSVHDNNMQSIMSMLTSKSICKHSCRIQQIQLTIPWCLLVCRFLQPPLSMQQHGGLPALFCSLTPLDIQLTKESCATTRHDLETATTDTGLSRVALVHLGPNSRGETQQNAEVCAEENCLDGQLAKEACLSARSGVLRDHDHTPRCWTGTICTPPLQLVCRTCRTHRLHTPTCPRRASFPQSALPPELFKEPCAAASASGSKVSISSTSTPYTWEMPWTR